MPQVAQVLPMTNFARPKAYVRNLHETVLRDEHVHGFEIAVDGSCIAEVIESEQKKPEPQLFGVACRSLTYKPVRL